MKSGDIDEEAAEAKKAIEVLGGEIVNNIGDWEIKRELMREKKDLVNKLKKYELKEKIRGVIL